jgi:hypothetical protein
MHATARNRDILVLSNKPFVTLWIRARIWERPPKTEGDERLNLGGRGVGQVSAFPTEYVRGHNLGVAV